MGGTDSFISLHQTSNVEGVYGFYRPSYITVLFRKAGILFEIYEQLELSSTRS